MNEEKAQIEVLRGRNYSYHAIYNVIKRIESAINGYIATKTRTLRSPKLMSERTVCIISRIQEQGKNNCGTCFGKDRRRRFTEHSARSISEKLASEMRPFERTNEVGVVSYTGKDEVDALIRLHSD